MGNRWTGWTRPAVNCLCGRTCSRGRTSGWRARWRWGRTCTITARTTALKSNTTPRNDVGITVRFAVLSFPPSETRRRLVSKTTIKIVQVSLFVHNSRSVACVLETRRARETKISAFGSDAFGPAQNRHDREFRSGELPVCRRLSTGSSTKAVVLGPTDRRDTCHFTSFPTLALCITLVCTNDSSLSSILVYSCFYVASQVVYAS